MLSPGSLAEQLASRSSSNLILSEYKTHFLKLKYKALHGKKTTTENWVFMQRFSDAAYTFLLSLGESH